MSSKLISTILVLSSSLFSSSSSHSPNSYPPLIRQICFTTKWNFDHDQCADILLSDAHIASAKNIRELSIAIMKAGQANATKTRSHIEDVLEKSKMDPNIKQAAFQECKSAYDLAAASFRSALSEVVDDNDPQTATYDLLVGCTDDLKPCLDYVSRANVEDDVLKRGNTALQIYGLSAYDAVNRL